MKKIYQLSSCIAVPDAVSSHVLAIDDLFAGSGFATKIFASHIDSQLKRPNLFQLEKFLPYQKESNSIIINHYSVHDKSAEYFLNAKGKKIFIYHNITPHKYFIGYNDEIASLCKTGRGLLPQFNSCDLSIALSDYSRQELLDAGFKLSKIRVLPYLLNFEDKFRLHRSIKSHSFIPPAQKHLLFVGKIAPHKKIEDVIKPFHLYRKYYQPNAHLHLVGVLGHDLYESELRSLVAKLDLGSNVTFHGRLDQERLSALFQIANIFITMSEHEGFCVPLIEAMYHRIPIIANAAAAISGTLGPGGLQIKEKDPGLIAEAIHCLTTDTKSIHQIVEAQSDQLEKFSSKTLAQQYKNVLSSFC